MAKRQIRINEASIRQLVKEAVQDRLNGVFSTDSEEGERYKEMFRKYNRPSSDRQIEGGRYQLADLGIGRDEKWQDYPGSELDTDKKRDIFAREDFADEKADSDRYDRPFGDLDDAENMYEPEPGFEEEDYEDDEELSEGRQIRMNESQMMEFVSYAVARLLKEGWDTSFSERVHKYHEEHPIDHGKNKGVCAHFNGGGFQPENPYKDMTWDEYCEAKRKEREERKSKEKLKDSEPKSDKPNLGVTTHFDGKKK